MYLPSVPVTNAVVASGGGDTEMRLASGYGAPTNSSYVSPGAAGSNPGGYGSNSHHHHQTPHSTSLADRFQEIEDDETLDDVGDGDDDALAHQMFGPLSPNPRAAIQLPEHEGTCCAFPKSRTTVFPYGPLTLSFIYLRVA